MTLEETIEHCEEVAEEKENLYKDCPIPPTACSGEKDCMDDSEGCKKCAKDHRQLAEWLKELKAYREADKEMRRFSQAWEEGAGINRCIETINKHIDKVVTIKDLEWRE